MVSDLEIRDRWYEFANHAFVTWRGNTRKTVSDFANWIGISQPLMSRQLRKNGAVPREQKVINAWVSKYGSVIYEIIGLDVPNDSLLLMPEPFRSIALELRDTLAEKNIDPDSPEAGAIMNEIMKKHGYDLTSMRVDPLE